MARIAYPTPDQQSEQAQHFLGKLPALNIFRMLSYCGHVLEPFVRLGSAFLSKGTLDPVLRESAILRVGHLCRAPYEVHQHERIARGLGMSESLLAMIEHGPSAAQLTPLQRDVLRYVDDVVENVRSSEPVFTALREQLGVVGLQELTLLIGYYLMVCRFLENFGVDIESDSDRSA